MFLITGGPLSPWTRALVCRVGTGTRVWEWLSGPPLAAGPTREKGSNQLGAEFLSPASR